MKENKSFKSLLVFTILIILCISLMQILSGSTVIETPTTVALNSNVILPDTPFDTVTLGITGDWWNNDWQYRKGIIVDHSMVAADLTNFPMLINTIDNDLRDDAQNDGDDIVFTDETGNKLAHEIECYNGTTGELWPN